jgi:TrpR family trp operon transcriptional repressor
MTMKTAWKSFLSLCLKSRNTDELAQLLECFLTIDEKENMIHRYEIIAALLAGKLTQREMAAELNVSIAKITRGSNALKSLNPKMKTFLKKNV